MSFNLDEEIRICEQSIKETARVVNEGVPDADLRDKYAQELLQLRTQRILLEILKKQP